MADQIVYGGDPGTPSRISDETVPPFSTAKSQIKFFDDGFDQYVEIPLSVFGQKGIQPTDIISHLANISVGYDSGNKITGALSVPALEAVSVAQSYFEKMPQDPATTSFECWTVHIESPASYNIAPPPGGSLSRVSMSLHPGYAPSNTQIEGRFAWDEDRRSMYIKFRSCGAPLEASTLDAPTAAPVKSIRTYIPPDAVQAILNEYQKRGMELMGQESEADSSTEGRI